MNSAVASSNLDRGGNDRVPASERGPASTRIVVTYGFWLFLLSDIVMFAAFFASYAVLHGHTAGGPSGRELFHRDKVLVETACLLLSSFSCALLSLSVDRQHKLASFACGLATLALGAAFVALEASELWTMLADGAGPSRSAFLSAFFALVGLHGLHVSAGVFWLLVMLAQIATLGFSPEVVRRMLCFSLFWHTLDIVWIGVFTIVYLGAFR
ncbi:cytochrome c oxidase subunit 3 [Variovorax sp. PAMC 28711]|uniref:cytochrome c oxidase subunit 3 n=1 Tax=Variovorax sp. PAMC 28711 TaxID=1795631 RepID=UPI00078C0318|nr:cytochrome c oxidase subunit 3 [Variovorax sp. PAMC 28711]AMM26313.1 cytochrome o ubiquinol oxidase subunit III [Variovorax sp. PAMC 28711]